MSVPDELAACSFEHPEPGYIVVAVAGELDACSTPRIEEQIRRTLGPEHRRIVLDLTDIAFIDSTGIRMVMLVAARRKQGDEVVVVGPALPSPRRTLEIIGLNRVVPLVSTRQDALAALKGEASGGSTGPG